MSVSIQRRHPNYEAWNETAKFLWESYVGGEVYRLGGYLDKYPRELDTVYDTRLQRATYHNYYATIIDTYISAVYRKDPAREGGPDEFFDDATGDGLSFTDFMRGVLTFSLAAERAFVGVDLLPSGAPYVHQIHPSNLLDFYEDKEGELHWALVAEKKIEAEDPFSDREEVDVYRLWQRDEWTLFSDQGAQIDSDRNVAGVVPIVGVNTGNANFRGWDIARIGRNIFNLTSQLGEIFANVTFPMLYAPGEGVMDGQEGDAISSDVSPIAIGTSRMMLLPEEAGTPPGYLVPPDGPAKLHMEERQRLIESMYSLASLERKDPDTINPQSGVAKAFDFRETRDRFVSLAIAAESAEQDILEIVSAYGTTGEVNVSYSKNFGIQGVSEQIENYQKMSEVPLPPALKRRAALELTEAIAEEATEEEREELRVAVQNMPDSQFNPPDDPINQLLRNS